MNRYALTLALMLCVVAASADKTVERRGDMYFKAACYPRAVIEYLKDYNRSPNDADLLKRIAEAVLLDESPRDTAVFFIEKYMDMVPDDVEAYYLAAQAHFHAHHFAKASKYVSEYLAMASKQTDKDKAEKLQSWIYNAQRMMKDTLKCALYNLGEMINTPNSEINPYLMPDDKTLFFSCDEKFNSNEIIKYFNIKFSDNVELSWTKSKAVGGNVNTLYDEYVSGLSKDRMFYCSNSDVSFAIFEAKYKGNGRFEDGVKLNYPIDSKGDEIAATLSTNADTIIFSATNSKGKLDLYYSIRFKGKWESARPLPGQINDSSSDDSYPNLSSDGKRLYFASNREGSMGGYDLYYSDLNVRTGEWGKPVQLKYPINDTYDNLSISFSSTGRYGYISAIRKGGFGNRDIYAVVFDNVMPSSAILRCYVGINTGGRPQPLTEQPLIEVRDMDGEVVARAKMNLSTSTFILALDPGKYELSIDTYEGKPHSETIEIDEKVYEPVAIEKIILLDPNK